jgi:hypothetical protein
MVKPFGAEASFGFLIGLPRRSRSRKLLRAPITAPSSSLALVKSAFALSFGRRAIAGPSGWGEPASCRARPGLGICRTAFSCCCSRRSLSRGLASASNRSCSSRSASKRSFSRSSISSFSSRWGRSASRRCFSRSVRSGEEKVI